MSARDQFLKALSGQAVRPVPVWLMRQAGRYLPEYRELKKKHGFLKMVQTPELATEVTLQPLRRFDFDAAILFSDILVIPEALGQPYSFREEGGIAMDFAIQRAEDVHRLQIEGLEERLAYVPGALGLLKRELSGKKALLGFAGSPFTLASYMLEGGSSQDYLATKRLFWENPKLYGELLEKLTAAVVRYGKMQAAAGADALQIFDSWGGILPGADYEEASLRWIRMLVQELSPHLPVILFGKGLVHQARAMAGTGARALSLDYVADLAAIRPELEGRVAIQGNLHPHVLETTPEITDRAVRRILSDLRDYPGHIFNLGHGIRPTARLECVAQLVETVRKS